MSGEAPTCNFVVNGHACTMGYYLSDGIYPKWATLIQTISHPINEKHKVLAEAQEVVRKDVERAFGGFASPIRNREVVGAPLGS